MSEPPRIPSAMEVALKQAGLNKPEPAPRRSPRSAPNGSSTALFASLKTEEDAREAVDRLKGRGFVEFSIERHERDVNGRMVERFLVECRHPKAEKAITFSTMPSRDAPKKGPRVKTMADYGREHRQGSS